MGGICAYELTSYTRGRNPFTAALPRRDSVTTAEHPGIRAGSLSVAKLLVLTCETLAAIEHPHTPVCGRALRCRDPRRRVQDAHYRQAPPHSHTRGRSQLPRSTRPSVKISPPPSTTRSPSLSSTRSPVPPPMSPAPFSSRP